MKKHVAFLLFLSVILAACGNGPARLQPSDPAVPIEVSVGDQFEIVLASNPSTGYSWALVDELDPGVVAVISQAYKGEEDPAPGSGGVDVWTFEALAPGETQIVLGYYPPSNDPTDPQQILEFTVTVK
jgi:inhibitor of cysteine peptidase